MTYNVSSGTLNPTIPYLWQSGYVSADRRNPADGDEETANFG